MSAKVPCTSTTGFGRCSEGVQLQSFAPGGGIPGAGSARATPVVDSAMSATTRSVPQNLPFT